MVLSRNIISISILFFFIGSYGKFAPKYDGYRPAMISGYLTTEDVIFDDILTEDDNHTKISEEMSIEDDNQITISEKVIIEDNNQKPLNILFVVSRFLSSSQTFILNTITELIDRGHNVSIFSFHKNNPYFPHPSMEKYKLLDRVIYEIVPKKLSECDIVFCQFGYLGKKIFEMKNLTEWFKTKKVVVCFRGSDTTSYVQKDAKVYQKLFKKGNLFLPVCDYFKKKLIELGCPAHKIVVQHSAIDCAQFFFLTRQKPVNDTIHLVSVCRLVKKKGIDYAIKAFAEIAKNYDNVDYTIVGDGPEKANLALLIQRLNLQDKITLSGWKSHDEIVSLLNRSHIFLLPSRKASDGNEEGIANALKEAMAMGLISIGTWHAGTPELIDDGVSGFLVPEKSISSLVQTIGYVIDHPEIWESIGMAARKKVEDAFEIGNSVEKLEELFYGLLT